MAEHFSFFDPVLDEFGIEDRDYNAQQFTNYFKSLVTTGIMKGERSELKVGTSGSNMVTTISDGVAFLLGRYYENDSSLSHTHETESLGKNRIDRIVVRLDLSIEARYVKSFVKKGVASPSPIPPDLTQTTNIYEISLAQVLVIGGQTYISANNVTDERGKDVICPWAGSKILPNFDDTTIGQPNGIAQLDSAGKVPDTQMRFNNTLTSTSTTEAATANAVKMVNDKIPVDSGDVAIPISSPFALVDGANPIRIRKIGKMVTVDGFIQIKQALNGNVIFELPVGFYSRSVASVTMTRMRGGTYSQVPGMVNTSSFAFYSDLYTQMAVNDYVSFSCTFVGRD